MKKYIDERSKTPLFDPYEIIKNVPAREWGPSKLIESQEDVYPEFSISRINMPVRASNSGDGPGTDMIKAPFQYWGNKKLGEYNIELAKKTIEDFEKQSHDQDTIESGPNYSIYRDALNYIEHVEGLKKYLNLPYDVNVIRESKYKPTRLQNTNQKTYVFAESTKPGYWNDVVNDMVTESYDNHQYQDPTLNTFTAYRDFDEKGDFVSIYDEWDYNPAVMGGHKMLNKLIDSATGGKSFVVYDRVYLDDYYDIPEEARGNPFITPAVVTAYKKGGNIHIKKKNRGKFTAAAKRAGMGVQEFARHVLANKDKYSSTLVKRANFARNSKKFKHENGGILKAQGGTGNLYTPHPLSPVGIALNQAKAMAKSKANQPHLAPGVKEVVGPDGKKVAIRIEQPLVPLEQSIAEWLPGTGDAAEIGYIANDVKNGNLGTAALAAGLMFLPGNARKILDKFGVDLGDISTFKRLSDQEWDDIYFQAIDSGDMDLVQTIRDAHFKVKAPNTKAVDADGNPIRLFHGEKDSPSYHDLRYLNSGPDHNGLGVYYSSNSKDIARTYAQYKGGPTGQVREVYYNIENPNTVDAGGRSFQTVLIEEGTNGAKTGVSTDQLVNRTYWDKAPEGYRKKSDKDGLIIQNVEDHAPGWTGSSEDAIADNYVTWNPHAVKSAEAVVRHPKTGEIIPISKRDNFNIPSILMGATPMILGLGAVKTVSNNSNTNTKEQL